MNTTGWRSTTIGELGRYLNGRAFKSSEWGDVGRPIIRIQNLTGSGDTFNHFNGVVEDRHIVRPGDLLVSWAATLGAYFWTGPEAVLNQHIFKVESSIEPRFHKYLLDYKLEELQRSAHGSGMVHITRGRFDAVKVAVPASSEQRRIVAILEDHLSCLDAAESGLTSATARADALLASAAAVALAEAGGTKTTIGAVSANVKNGLFVSRSTQKATGVQILRIGSVRPMKIDFTNSGRSGLTDAEVDAAGGRLAEGDVLFTRYNGNPKLVGSAAVVPAVGQSFTYPDKLIRVRLRQDVIRSEFLAIVARWGPTRAYLQSRVKTTSGQAGISGADLKAAPLILPSLDQQDAIIERIAEVESGAAGLVDSVGRARRRSERLRRAALEAAFSGRLTGAASDSARIEDLAAAL